MQQLTPMQVAALKEAQRRYAGEAAYQQGRAHYFQRYKTDKAKTEAVEHIAAAEKYRQWSEALLQLINGV